MTLPVISSLKIKVYQLKRAFKALFYYGADDIVFKNIKKYLNFYHFLFLIRIINNIKEY